MNGQRRQLSQSCKARGLNEKHRAIVQVKQKWHFIGKTLSKIVPAKIKHLYCIYMLLFSKRAKYRIYTFVIKDSMLQEINASHLQKVLIKKSGLLTSLVKPQTFTRSKEQTSIKVGNIQNSAPRFTRPTEIWFPLVFISAHSQRRRALSVIILRILELKEEQWGKL